MVIGFAVLLAGPSPASAINLWPFPSKDEQLLEQLRSARSEGDLNLAQALVNELAELRPADDPELGLERGRLAVARGQLDIATAILERVANEAPHTEAREELAAVYVRLGRWPDAVSTLGQALEERGSTLPADALRADPRFAELVGFVPFDGLIERAREIQAGPLGRMMIRLERLEGSARETVDALEKFTELLTLVARIATSFLFPLVSFVLLGLLSTAGAAQLGPLGRPWTLLVGFGAASAIWVSGTQRLTAGASTGVETVVLGTGVVFGAWVALVLVAMALRALRRRFRVDPWDPAERDLTLALLEDVEHLAEAVQRGDAEEQELRDVTERLRQRLEGRPREAAPASDSADQSHKDGNLEEAEPADG